MFNFKYELREIVKDHIERCKTVDPTKNLFLYNVTLTIIVRSKSFKCLNDNDNSAVLLLKAHSAVRIYSITPISSEYYFCSAQHCVTQFVDKLLQLEKHVSEQFQSTFGQIWHKTEGKINKVIFRCLREQQSERREKSRDHMHIAANYWGPAY